MLSRALVQQELKHALLFGLGLTIVVRCRDDVRHFLQIPIFFDFFNNYYSADMWTEIYIYIQV